MNANLDKIALELYGKIQTRFNDIKIGDENAAVLSRKEDIPKARFFEFEYEEDGVPLGTITITLDADDGVIVQVSGDLVNDDDSTTRHGAYKFIRSFRQFAKDRLLNFDIQNIGKSNLDKRDYTFQAKRKEEPVMAQQPVMENKMYGSIKLSYQDLGEARLVVKHTQPVDESNPAGRTMHIEAIYIENAQGERFKYPYKHLNGARALAEHIKHGGTPYDAIGKHICSLSEELASLRKFKGYVSRQAQLSEAMANVTNRVIDRIDQIKETISKLQRPAYYEAYIESFEESDDIMIPEEIQNDLIDRLTIRTFNEELKSVFPYIYKFVDESELPVVELGADDLLGEEPEDEKHERGYNEAFDPESEYESFMNDIISENKNELFSPLDGAQSSAIDKVNDIISQDIEIGPEGTNAVLSLKGLIDDSQFVELLRTAPAETKLNPLLQGWLATEHEDILSKLDFPAAGQTPTPAPAEPTAAAEPMPEPVAEPTAAAEPAPAEPTAAAEPMPEPAEEPAPVAEGKKDDNDPPFDPDPKPRGKTTPGKHGQGYSQARHLARQGMADMLKKAQKAGATLETQLDFGDRVMTIAEICDECGVAPADIGFADQPKMQGIEGMMKFISGFYNREANNFPLGGARIKIKVKKAFEDGEFGDASTDDLVKVLKFIDHKDPSDSHEQHAILKLAGVKKDAVQDECGSMPSFDISTIESQLASVSESKGYSEDQTLASIVHLAGLK